ncbi:MAG: molybdenum cofactor synthesis domain-containing protein [Bacteroidales bacterium]
MEKLIIKSVNISDKKGVIKKPVSQIKLDANGVQLDAHAGKWHRQVSILGSNSIARFSKELKREILPGEFAENITLDGFEVEQMKVFDRFRYREVELEVTQIGKKCHGTNCAIYNETGNCVMPKEGVFCRVIRGGVLTPGDEFVYYPKIVNIRVITLSDRAAAGVYADRSGPFLSKLLQEFFRSNGRKVNIKQILIGDNAEDLKAQVLISVEENADLIFTTGGTGIGPRDITPDVVRPLLDNEITGIMELIRVKYGAEHPNALVSRSVAGMIKQSLIYTLPGSTKAVKEYTTEILKTVEHSWRMIYGIDNH